MNNIYDVYKKAIRVIDSCDNEIQMVGAVNYCNLFKDQYLKTGGDELLVKIYHSNLIEHLNTRINEDFKN